MAAKIKDGLFIGDAETSQSEVFINDNKISNLINLAGREVHNVWASHGLVYLTYYWEDRPDYKLFTNHEDALLTDIVEFIDVSISHGISVLLFSRNGTGRCVVAACLYLMMKYRWGFEKTYDYVYSKKPDIDLNKGFIQQMFALDMKLLAARQKAYAAKNGIENKFKIEANMTISDISRMLPPEEAKRWNAWDPDYVLEGSTEAGGGMDGESKGGEGSGGRYKDSKEFKRADSRRSSPGSRPNNSVAISGPGTGEDDELILIYSFLNSKNTITVLPGPYLDVYETHKNFKLKFNPICFEEDVNWFPSASVVPARASMKGSRAKLAAAQASAQPKVYSSAPHSSSMAENKRDAKFGDAPSSGSFSSNPKSVVALENIAPMYIINSQRENRDRGLAADGTSYNNSSGNSSSNGTSAQMYYSHPAMTTAPGDHHYNADQDVSPPTSAPSSAHSSPAHTNPYAAHSINNNSNNSNSANNAGGGGGGGMSRQGSNVSITSMGSHSQAAQSYSSDLYEFVGISTVDGVRGKTSREGPQRTWGPRDSIAVHKDKDQHHAAGSDNSSVHSSSHHSHRGGFPEEYKEEVQAQVSRDPRQQPPPPPQQPHHQQQQQLSAEDRLRNLMADMQRHKPTSSSAVAAAPGAGASGGHHSRHHTSNSSSRGAERESSRPEARSEPSGPSLYELATMQIGSGGGGAGSRGSSHGGGYPQGGGGGGVDDIEEEDLADPLSAFQRQQQHQQYAGSSSGGGSKGASSAGGAVRARHDIITHNSSGSGRPGSAGPVGRSAVGSSVPGPRTAWASGTGPSPVPSSSGSAGVRGVSPSSSRASSPSPGAVGGSGGGAGRSASPVGPSKRMVGGAGSVSSNLSVNSINSSGSNQVVGSGISSGSKVYR